MGAICIQIFCSANKQNISASMDNDYMYKHVIKSGSINVT